MAELNEKYGLFIPWCEHAEMTPVKSFPVFSFVLQSVDWILQKQKW